MIDIVKINTLIVMFKASKHTITNNINKLLISGGKNNFLRKNIRPERKSY